LNKTGLKITVYTYLLFMTLVIAFNFPMYINNYTFDSRISNLQTNNVPALVWTDNGTAIIAENFYQVNPQIIEDGNGGAIIVWEDIRDGVNYDIYAQKIGMNGSLLWDPNGIVVCSATGNQYKPKLCSDGNGGAIITWYDSRGLYSHIYAQHINANGQVQWTTNGIAICTAIQGQYYPEIISDGKNGAIIVWQDYRTGTDFDIYAQRIDSNGVILWDANGTAICTKNGTQENVKLCEDGDGGAIIVWVDSRGATGKDIYAQKINSSGAVQWTVDGVAVCAQVNDQDLPGILSNGQGGAIICWEDRRSGTYYDIYGQMLNASGQIQWNPTCNIICNAADNQRSVSLCSDGGNGAIITWHDQRSSSYDIYAQKINFSGITQWTNNGTPICVAAGNQFHPKISSSSSNDAIITWYDQRSGNSDIYAQKVNSTGQTIWTANGIVICNKQNNQETPIICSDGAECAIIVWTDARNISRINIYAQRIAIDRPPQVFHPNDPITTVSGTETLDWIIVDDFGPGEFRVWVNISENDYQVYIGWTSWTNNTVLQLPISRFALGIYNYTIEYNDSSNQFGTPDSIIVTVINDPTVVPGIPGFIAVFILLGIISSIALSLKLKNKNKI